MACKEHLNKPTGSPNDIICYDLEKFIGPASISGECYFTIPSTPEEIVLDKKIKEVILYGSRNITIPISKTIQSFYFFYRILIQLKLYIDVFISVPINLKDIGKNLNKNDHEKVTDFVKNIINLYLLLNIILFDEEDAVIPSDKFYYFENYGTKAWDTDPQSKIIPFIASLRVGKLKKTNKFEQRFTKDFAWNNNDEMITLEINIVEFFKSIITQNTDESTAFNLLYQAPDRPHINQVGQKYHLSMDGILRNVHDCLSK